LIFTILEIFILIAIILARICECLINKIKQSAVIGEIIAGFIFGAYGLGGFSGLSFVVFVWNIVFPQIDYVNDDFEIFTYKRPI
jgi:Kef-type K+ transport system membrane component KefB